MWVAGLKAGASVGLTASFYTADECEGMKLSKAT